MLDILFLTIFFVGVYVLKNATIVPLINIEATYWKGKKTILGMPIKAVI